MDFKRILFAAMAIMVIILFLNWVFDLVVGWHEILQQLRSDL